MSQFKLLKQEYIIFNSTPSKNSIVMARGVHIESTVHIGYKYFIWNSSLAFSLTPSAIWSVYSQDIFACTSKFAHCSNYTLSVCDILNIRQTVITFRACSVVTGNAAVYIVHWHDREVRSVNLLKPAFILRFK